MSMLLDLAEIREKRSPLITQFLANYSRSGDDVIMIDNCIASLQRIYFTCLVILDKRPKDNWTPSDVEAVVNEVAKRTWDSNIPL